MKAGKVVLVLICVALAGCATQQEQRDQAIQKARTHCESEGKQFVLGNVEQTGDAIFSSMDTTVSGECIGPGDPGYVPPKPDQSTTPAH
jgi:hypothetical protein